VSRFDRFVRELAATAVSDRAANQYARFSPSAAGNFVRRANLRRYLMMVAERRPTMLLVGEAPSHRGARLTGIPFVSERLLIEGVSLAGGGRALGTEGGYRSTDETARPSTEASATMVWGAIRDIEPLPLLWNAFPFHPFQRGNPCSNRAPTPQELLAGERFLSWLLRLFPMQHVVAVGNSASRSLTRMQIAHTKVRHPSQGGKRKFLEGVSGCVADVTSRAARSGGASRRHTAMGEERS
jgi:uracil-DNA glycosylase